MYNSESRFKLFQGKILQFIKFDEKFCEGLNKLIDDQVIKKPANPFLIGEIENEYLIDMKNPDLEKYLIHIKEVFLKFINFQKQYELMASSSKATSIRFTLAWVNLMKKNDYNPVHIHDNNTHNLIIWMNDVEIKNSKSKALKTVYDFVDDRVLFNTFYGYDGAHTIIVNNDTMQMLPRKYYGLIYEKDVLHAVYPTNSDEIRKSIVFNLKVKYESDRSKESP